MLTPEQAKTRLAQFRSEDPGGRTEAAVARLPGPARAAGEELLGLLARNRYWFWESEPAVTRAMGARIGGLGAAHRLELCRALLPDLAEDVAAAWEALRVWPYQLGANRRMFRAPRDPAVSAPMRVGWLVGLYLALQQYRGDVQWLAVWAGHLPSWEISNPGGMLLATVIDRGGRTGAAVLATLQAAAAGTHEIAAFGRHVVRALLCAGRREGWEVIEQLLLRAQREEGLRQVILETIDEAHPEAFRRMLALIVEHGLARFSAVARAVDVWFGFQWDSDQARAIDTTARRVLAWLPEPAARRQVLADPAASAEDLYLALWCAAQADAVAAVEPARPLLRSASVETRYAATYFLQQLDHAPARAALHGVLGDADLRVTDRAVAAFMASAECQPARPDLFEQLESLVARWPAKAAATEPLIWPWCRHDLDPARLGRALLTSLGDRPFLRLLPHVQRMDVETRAQLCKQIDTAGSGGEARPLLVQLLGDVSPAVRGKAFAAFGRLPVRSEDLAALEALLTRRTDDLRRAVLDQILRLPDAAVQQSVERLLGARHEPQRAAGVELLRRLVTDARVVAWAQARAATLATEPAAATTRGALDAIAAPAAPAPTLDDALGLSPPAARTALATPVARRIERVSRAAARLLTALDGFVEAHAATPVVAGLQRAEAPLGSLQVWAVARADGNRTASREQLPLREAFTAFWKGRGPESRDRDGLELPRALLLLDHGVEARPGMLAAIARVFGDVTSPTLRYPDVVEMYLRWMLYLELPVGAVDFALDALETSYAGLSAPDWQDMLRRELYLAQTPAGARAAWRAEDLATTIAEAWRPDWSPAQRVRLWHLHRIRCAQQPASRIDLDLWLEMYESGVASDADFAALLLRPLHPVRTESYYRGDSHRELAAVSGQVMWGKAPVPPRTLALVQRARTRLLDLELRRGETPTAASEPCQALRWTGGLEVLARVSHALAGASLRRGLSSWTSDRLGRESSLSHILQRTRPGEGDTPERFAAELPVKAVGEARLSEIAMFAPHWAAHVEHALGWPGLAEAVWWMHAHTKDSKWSVEEELREAWKAQTSERTPLSGQDLLDGAVDVAWFGRVRLALGDQRFGRLLDLAKYASSGTGHARAKLFAAALLGSAARAELLAGVQARRHQDSVRALGLLPLAAGEARAPDLLERYLAIQEFVRGARQFGSQRQASEKRAAAIGLQNLARTAGYRDPARLEWAMERAALGDLARGPAHAVAGEVEVTLALGADGNAELVARKKGKTLKAVPAAARKDPAVKALLDQAAGIDQQRQRMRVSLEHAMIAGDAFTGTELVTLMEHPVLAPQLTRLVLVGPDLCGYPAAGGRELLGHDGTKVQVANDAELRIAHPHDLLTGGPSAGGQWAQWQRDCLRRELVQPFKQVFRELYVLTAAEQEDGLRSRRYAGHQVEPRRAMALLGSRGWVWHAEEGVRKVDHQAGIAAWIEFQNLAFTPGDVEGLTLEGVAFTRRGEWTALPLTTIPPRLLSETLRDVDLVVGVASRSGVDPEASASSMEARAALVRATCELLGLANVRVESRLVLIAGKLAQYSIHLGSGSVHQLPGGHLCIIAVHAQHRGRVFLPFADDDPRTAEILSKVLLLARDDQIKDPTILEQLRR